MLQRGVEEDGARGALCLPVCSSMFQTTTIVDEIHRAGAEQSQAIEGRAPTSLCTSEAFRHAPRILLLNPSLG